MEFYSAVLFCRKLASVPTVRNYSTLMEFWQVSLALPSSCICPSYSVLCSSRPSSRPPSRNHLKIADFATEKQASAFLSNFIILVASNSLYHSTILLIFTPYCIFGFCVESQLLCVIILSLVNAVQRCIILILVYTN